MAARDAISPLLFRVCPSLGAAKQKSADRPASAGSDRRSVRITSRGIRLRVPKRWDARSRLRPHLGIIEYHQARLQIIPRQVGYYLQLFLSLYNLHARY